MLSRLYSLFTKKPSVKRSPKWNALRKKWVKNNSQCVACTKTKNIAVHHIKPVHLFPEFELDESNLITLCENHSMNCHFVLGHKMNWFSFNPDVRTDAAVFRNKIKGTV